MRTAGVLELRVHKIQYTRTEALTKTDVLPKTNAFTIDSPTKNYVRTKNDMIT